MMLFMAFSIKFMTYFSNITLPVSLSLFQANRLNNFHFIFVIHLIAEFSTYAKIEITKNGYRHLRLNGYTYGETKVGDRSVYWRCTANLRDEKGKSKRCVTHIVTEVRNGYEMIRKTNVRHKHPRSTRRRRR